MSFVSRVTARYQVVATEGWQTATGRGVSAPLKLLLDRGLIPEGSRVLDYGCGRGADVAHLQSLGYDAVGYDPKWRPEKPTGKFDIITCVYVLNVRDEATGDEIIADIKNHLAPGGKAFISVRRDLPEEGAPGKGGCWQRLVACPNGFATIPSTPKGYAIFTKGL